MDRTADTRYEFKSIGHILSTKRLKVPAYQRSFAWKNEHVEELFQDLNAAQRAGEEEYFLGAVVTTEGENGRDEIVDGQQRLATTTMLIAAVRDYFDSVGDAERVKQLEQLYLMEVEFRTQERTPRVQLNDTDDDYFRKRVLLRPGDAERMGVTPVKESHERISAAAELAKKHVSAIASTTNRPSDALADLVEYLNGAARVIFLRAASTANAFIIFETLNDRGLDLAISDLLKNFLFLTAEDRIAEVQLDWTAMLATIETVADESTLVDFIRHYWSSKYGATRERELYARMKAKLTSKQGAVDFAKELASASKLYAAILNTDSQFWVKYKATAKGHMGTINHLGMVQVRPLLLAVLDKFSVAEARTTLRLTVSWGVRLLIVGGLGGGTMEKHYSDQACAVRKGTIKTAKALNKALANVVPTDKEFEEGFANARVSKAALARYYLLALERKALEESQPELVPNSNQEEVNLEHVLPQKPSPNWSGFSPEEQKAYHKRIGNLALMSAGENSAASDEAFATKAVAYKKSKLTLTKSIAKSRAWTTDSIEKRQRHLAKLAVTTWLLK